MSERQAAGSEKGSRRWIRWSSLALLTVLAACARFLPTPRPADPSPQGGASASAGTAGAPGASVSAAAGASAGSVAAGGAAGVSAGSAAAGGAAGDATTSLPGLSPAFASAAVVTPPPAPDAADAARRRSAAARDTGRAGAKPVAKDSIDVTPTEIVNEAKKVFGDAVVPRADSAGPLAPSWDIDVRSYETHVRVEHFVNVFSGRAKAPFEKALQRQTRYGALIGGALRDGGLPEDLTYLALVESWYDPHAYSKAAAVGMWQFMTRTARGVGLRVDWWVDERRDPVRATQGAVRLLRSLKTQFGSLYLAAAAYNGGDGRVSRGLARYASDMNGVEGEDRFFSLADTKYLRPETRDYVPKIIAAALVGKEPSRYGVVVESLPPLAFDSVRVAGGTPLAAIANAAGATVALAKELNPHILRGATPPGDSFWVRVPSGTGGAFADHFSALEPDEQRAFNRVETKKGESMASVARKRGITAKQLAAYNPKALRLKSGNLTPGQSLLVPTAATVAAALTVPDPSIERYPRRAKATVAAKGGTGKATGAKGATVAAKKKAPAKAGAAKKSVAGKGTAKKGAAKSGAVKPGAAKSGAVKPGVAKSGAAKSGAAKAAPKSGASKAAAAKQPTP